MKDINVKIEKNINMNLNWYKLAQVNNLGNQVLEILKKNPQAYVLCYHGTSLTTYDKIKSSGKLLPPSKTGEAAEFHEDERTGRIFLTQNKQYAADYAERSAIQNKSHPIVLTLKIPISMTYEVTQALANPDFLRGNSFEGIVGTNLYNLMQSETDINRLSQKLVDYFKKEVTDNQEVSVNGDIPLNYIVAEEPFKIDVNKYRPYFQSLRPDQVAYLQQYKI